MTQIEIEIEDPKKFANVAFLVDKADFLEDAAKLRQKWVQNSLVVPYEKYYDWYSNKFHKPSKILFKKHHEELAKYQNKYRFKVGEGIPAQAKKELERVYRILPQWDFHFDMLHLTSKYHRPRFFVRVAIVATVCGKVTDKDYESVYINTTPMGIPISISPIAPAYPWLLEFELRFSPWTKETEIVEAFRSFKNSEKSFEYYEKVWGKILNPDTISNIKRDREWYWRNLDGKNYKDIAIADNKGVKYYREAQEAEKHIKNVPDKLATEYIRHLRDIEKYAEKVRKAIKQYQKPLQKNP